MIDQLILDKLGEEAFIKWEQLIANLPYDPLNLTDQRVTATNFSQPVTIEPESLDLHLDVNCFVIFYQGRYLALWVPALESWFERRPGESPIQMWNRADAAYDAR